MARLLRIRVSMRCFSRLFALLFALTLPAQAQHAAWMARAVAPPQADVVREDNSVPQRSESKSSGSVAVPASRGQEPKRRVWYGQYTLITDGVALGTLAIIPAGGDVLAVGGVSLGIYLLGGPIVHLKHRQVGRAVGSLLIRAALPLLGGVIGSGTEDCPVDSRGDTAAFCGAAGFATGAIVGAIGAMALDAAVLAYKNVDAEPAIVPVVQVGKTGSWVGLSGRF